MPVSRAPVRRGPRLPLSSVALLLILLLAVTGCATVAPAAPLATTAPDRSASVARNRATSTAMARRSTTTRTPAAGQTQGQAPQTGPGGLAIPTPLPGDKFRTVAVGQLPPEAVTTLTLIAHDGPFPYSQDGVVFQNREGLLPRQANGYYHEYTVKTPGASDRGARRIIRGSQGELFYTDDHYASFRRIVP